MPSKLYLSYCTHASWCYLVVQNKWHYWSPKLHIMNSKFRCMEAHRDERFRSHSKYIHWGWCTKGMPPTTKVKWRPLRHFECWKVSSTWDSTRSWPMWIRHVASFFHNVIIRSYGVVVSNLGTSNFSTLFWSLCPIMSGLIGVVIGSCKDYPFKFHDRSWDAHDRRGQIKIMFLF